MGCVFFLLPRHPLVWKPPRMQSSSGLSCTVACFRGADVPGCRESGRPSSTAGCAASMAHLPFAWACHLRRAQLNLHRSHVPQYSNAFASPATDETGLMRPIVEESPANSNPSAHLLACLHPHRPNRGCGGGSI